MVAKNTAHRKLAFRRHADKYCCYQATVLAGSTQTWRTSFKMHNADGTTLTSSVSCIQFLRTCHFALFYHCSQFAALSFLSIWQNLLSLELSSQHSFFFL